jgi:hypothetical protein
MRVIRGGETMANTNCYAARGINIIFGLVLILLAIILFFSGFSFLPFFGFLLAAAFLGFSVRVFFAPRDKSCFSPR